MVHAAPDAERRDWLVQARRGLLELCVLALIARRPRYGYQLTTALSDLGQPLAAPEGTLYPLLRRLQREGMVDASWQSSPEGPPRKYYHLTDAGERLLAAQLAEWDALARAIDALRTQIAPTSDTVDKEVPDGTGSQRQPSLPRPAARSAGAPARS